MVFLHKFRVFLRFREPGPGRAPDPAQSENLEDIGWDFFDFGRILLIFGGIPRFSEDFGDFRKDFGDFRKDFSLPARLEPIDFIDISWFPLILLKSLSYGQWFWKKSQNESYRTRVTKSSFGQRVRLPWVKISTEGSFERYPTISFKGSHRFAIGRQRKKSWMGVNGCTKSHRKPE